MDHAIILEIEERLLSTELKVVLFPFINFFELCFLKY